MKRILFAVLCLISVGAYAQQISVEQAEKSALEFIRMARQRNNSANAKMITGTPKLSLAYTAKQEGKVQFYVFNESEGGFIVAGGDESAEEILAYADNGNFDVQTANPNLKYWLEMFQKEILAESQKSITDNREQRAKSKESRVDVPILIQTRWDQEAPYNNAIKSATSVSYPTGCVATSMSQVMKYYEWPVTGTGSHSYYDSESSRKNYSRDFSEHTYDWANMLNKYTGSYSSAKGNAVAELMFDAGVSVNMMYGRNGSAAYTEQVPYALASFFGYDKGVGHRYRDYYSDDEWDELLYDELAAGRPVMYAGCNLDDGGHSFICDGYDASTGKYHFNWGWSGDGDCYCALSAVKCGSTVFNYYQDMVYGIQKPCAGSAKPNIIIYDECYLESSKTEKDGYATYKLTFGLDAEKLPGFIWNDSYIDCKILFNIKYVNQETGKAYYATQKNSSANVYNFNGLIVDEGLWDNYFEYENITVSDVKIPDMPSGEYRVYLVYKDWANKDDESVEWATVRAFTTKKNYVVETIESNIDVPESLDATDVTGNGFVANWSAVEGVESYTLYLATVSKDKTTVTALDEDFAVFDSKTSVGITDIGANMDAYMPVAGWTGKKVYTAPGSLKLGSSTEGGSLTTPTLTASGKVKVVVGENVYNSTDATEITVVVGDAKETFVAEGKQHTIEAEVYGDFNVTISTQGSKQRAFVNYINVTTESSDVKTTLIEGITDTKYSFTGLDANKEYIYKVRANVGEDCSEWSAPVTVTLKAIEPEGTCEAPEIEYADGMLKITSSTDGAKCFYTLDDADVKKVFTEVGNDVKLGVTYVINAYASKEGWLNSDTVVAVISWLEKLPEPVTDVFAVKAIPVIVQQAGENLAVSGLPDDIEVSVYTVGGMLIGSTTSKNGVAAIPVEIKKNDVIIIKIGDNAIKYVLK